MLTATQRGRLMLLIGAVIGGVWFGLFLAGHLTALLWGPRPPRSGTAFGLFLPAVVGSAVSAVLLPLEAAPWAGPDSHRAVAAAGAVVTVSCGFVLWMPAYYVVVSSITGQLLVRLEAAPGGVLSLDELTGPTTSREILRPRLASMVRSGLLIHEDGGYRVTPKGHRVAGVFRTLRSLWRLHPDG